MSDLFCRCPKCNKKNYRYIHAVDSHTGMGTWIPSGEYDMICDKSGYRSDDSKKYCGHKYTIRLEVKEVVTVIRGKVRKK